MLKTGYDDIWLLTIQKIIRSELHSFLYLMIVQNPRVFCQINLISQPTDESKTPPMRTKDVSVWGIPAM